MKIKQTFVSNPHKAVAAEMARTGLISMGDLSLLTGVETPRLSALTKRKVLRSYNEYHGKTFFNFTEILTWLAESGEHEEQKREIRTKMEEESKTQDCPYILNFVTADNSFSFEFVWKDLQPA